MIPTPPSSGGGFRVCQSLLAFLYPLLFRAPRRHNRSRRNQSTFHDHAKCCLCSMDSFEVRDHSIILRVEIQVRAGSDSKSFFPPDVFGEVQILNKYDHLIHQRPPTSASSFQFASE